MRQLVNALVEFEGLGIDFSYEGRTRPRRQRRLLFGLWRAWAEFECSLIAERVKAGMQRAKAQGDTPGDHGCRKGSRRVFWPVEGGELSASATGSGSGVSHEDRPVLLAKGTA